MAKEKLTEEQRRTMKRLFEENGLTKDDVHTHKHYVIITRSGIEKIQAKQGISVSFEVCRSEPDFASVKATGRKGGTNKIETFGSASPKTCQSAYYLEMAEKRALSRVVLKLCNLYEFGVFGEDENVDSQKS